MIKHAGLVETFGLFKQFYITCCMVWGVVCFMVWGEIKHGLHNAYIFIYIDIQMYVYIVM